VWALAMSYPSGQAFYLQEGKWNEQLAERVPVGKQFAHGFGLSAHFFDMEQFRPGLLPPPELEFRRVYKLKMSYSF
jgi:hypothetical protein